MVLHPRVRGIFHIGSERVNPQDLRKIASFLPAGELRALVRVSSDRQVMRLEREIRREIATKLKQNRIDNKKARST